MLLILWEKKETVLSHDVNKVNNLMDSLSNLSNPMEDKYIKFCHIYYNSF